MENSNENTFGAIRLRRETIANLAELKHSFEVIESKKLTMDEFMATLIKSLEVGNPEVWDIYNTTIEMKAMLAAKIQNVREAQKRRAVAGIPAPQEETPAETKESQEDQYSAS